MSEYDDIAHRFARAASPAPSETFVDAVRQRVEAERRRAKVVAFAAALAIAIVVAIVLLAVPLDMLYPLTLVQTFLMSTPGMIVCAAGAIVVAARLRRADA